MVGLLILILFALIGVIVLAVKKGQKGWSILFRFIIVPILHIYNLL